MVNPKPPLAAGMILGIWLAWLYAFIVNEVNRVNLPGVPLADPPGGWVGYYLGALAAGMLVGLICTWPQRGWLGIPAGSILGAVLIPIAPWKPSPLPSTSVAAAIDLIFNQWIPMVLVLTPFVVLLRFSARQLSAGAKGSPTILRVILPLLTTAAVVTTGIMSLYTAPIREAFITTHKLVDEGLDAPGLNQLPQSLQSVQGFIPNATGRYTLELSYELTRFHGTQLMITQTSNNFLIVARFKNDFLMACNFAPGVPVPPCGNFR